MPGPVVPPAALLEWLAPRRAAHQRVVLTNGVFDLLHVGHLRYLRAARALGDLLIVGVNADEATRRLKPGRPLLPEDERAELVAALAPVDAVVLFAEPTADALIAAVRPDVYVKGGDYDEATLPEAAAARAVGARLAFVPLVEGRSTSALIERLGGASPTAVAPPVERAEG